MCIDASVYTLEALSGTHVTVVIGNTLGKSGKMTSFTTFESWFVRCQLSLIIRQRCMAAVERPWGLQKGEVYLI